MFYFENREKFKRFLCENALSHYTSVNAYLTEILSFLDIMLQVIYPICGKFVSFRYYDPLDFEDDVFLVQV